MNVFNLRIITPQSCVFEGKAKNISIHTLSGAIQIFAHHMSIIHPVAFSPLVFVDDTNRQHSYIVKKGILSVNNRTNMVRLAVSECLTVSLMEKTTAESYLAFIEEQLEKGNALGAFHVDFYQQEYLVVKKQLKHMETHAS